MKLFWNNGLLETDLAPDLQAYFTSPGAPAQVFRRHNNGR